MIKHSSPLATLRKTHGLTQHRLADLCGCHRNNMQAYETGRCSTDNMTLKLAHSMASAFGITLDEFYRIVKPEEPTKIDWGI